MEETSLSTFLSTGIYNLDNSGVSFIDPVRLLNDSYTRFTISPSSYYSRSFHSPPPNPKPNPSKKRKKRNHHLNQAELSAEKRHQEARPLLLKAHDLLLRTEDLLRVLPNLAAKRNDNDEEVEGRVRELDFIELGKLWQAPLYDISIPPSTETHAQGTCLGDDGARTVVPLFNNLVSNKTADDVEAEFLDSRYVLPSRSSFYMPEHGFNLIVIDPPWENGSAYQKAVYPTLPNRYFLCLPVKQLAHAEGALVAMWMTNREKLRRFVEKELFPSWGVTNASNIYWLKVKPDGSLIGDLDLFHHRPYESLLVGYVNVKSVDSDCPPTFTYLQDDRIFISIPGAYSRKPPLGKLLLDHIPGPRPARCIELFARELTGGWTSWGNEPLRFQDARYFIERVNNDAAT